MDLDGKREALVEFARGFYANRIAIDLGKSVETTLESLVRPATPLIQMAHDGQLPHLGIVRMVIKADQIVRLAGGGVTLYLVGNHYSPSMRPENIRFGMPLKGQSPDDVKHPPRVRIGKANARTPFRWLKPPAQEDLLRLHDQVRDFVTNNLTHEEKEGRTLVPQTESQIASRLETAFALLRTAAASVANFGDWLVRVQHDLFHVLLGEEADRILFLPMADLATLLGPELVRLSRDSDTVARLKSEVSADQTARGEEPYLRGGESHAFWIHCPSCFRRQRAPWSPEGSLEFACRACGQRRRMEGGALWDWMMPDIVAYEAALFRLGIDGWVVGSHASYHPVIERVYATVFGGEVPPRFFLTSVPTFRGLGDPPEGYRRTRLLRALLEMEPAAIANALRAPWEENPSLRSDLFSP